MPENDFDICVIVPALNEESTIRETVANVTAAAATTGRRLQLLLVNDGGTDGTGARMDELAQETPDTTVIHHPTPQGLAISFKEGVAHARAPRVSVIPGDNAYSAEGIETFFGALDDAEMVVTYRANQRQARTGVRYFLSMAFTVVVAILFRGGVRDYHSMVSYPVDILRRVPLRAGSSGYQIEAVVRCLRRAGSITEVPVTLNRNPKTRSAVLRFRTLLQLAVTICDLIVRR